MSMDETTDFYQIFLSIVNWFIIIIILGGFGPNHCYVEAGEHEYRLTQYLMSSYEVNQVFPGQALYIHLATHFCQNEL